MVGHLIYSSDIKRCYIQEGDLYWRVCDIFSRLGGILYMVEALASYVDVGETKTLGHLHLYLGHYSPPEHHW